MTRAYYLRPMPNAVAGKYFCCDRDKFNALCCQKATYYLVAKPQKGRPRLWRRCEECARRNAKKLGIVFEEPKR